jgi:hypothetical protein
MATLPLGPISRNDAAVLAAAREGPAGFLAGILATRMEKLEAGQKGHASIFSVIVEEINKLKQRPEPPAKTTHWLPRPWRKRLTPALCHHNL